MFDKRSTFVVVGILWQFIFCHKTKDDCFLSKKLLRFFLHIQHFLKNIGNICIFYPKFAPSQKKTFIQKKVKKNILTL